MQIRDLRSKAGERDYYLRMAQMDGLTELFNRNAFHGFLEREGARALRSGRDLSLLVADFTSLSLIHQDYGTLYGDRVVRRVAHALRTACRAYDIVARIDAGRFAVLAPDTDNAGGLVLAHRLSSAVAADEAAGDRREIPLALAVGAAGFTADAREIPQLVEKAERACGAAASTREHVVAAADLDS
jgi:diguanylate cyclase (GGDEF)-like protein